MRLSLANQVLFLWAAQTDPVKRQIVLLLFKALLAGTPLLCLILYQVFCPTARRLRHWSALVNWLWPVGLSHAAHSGPTTEHGFRANATDSPVDSAS